MLSTSKERVHDSVTEPEEGKMGMEERNDDEYVAIYKHRCAKTQNKKINW